jgi:hypothetical protein
MATTTTVASAAAGVGDLGQRYDHRDKHGRHQTEKFTTHDTLLLHTVPPYPPSP